MFEGANGASAYAGIMEKNGCSHGGIYSAQNTAMVKIDFSSNVNPLGPPPQVVATIKKDAKRLVPQYPDPECSELKQKLSVYTQCDEDQIFVGNGALEIIHIFARLYAKHRAVIAAPTFCEYELAAQRAGGLVTFVPLEADRQPDADSLIENAVAKGAAAVFLCNPNNPTGLLSTDSVKRVIESLGRTKTMILIDECFIELSDRPGDTVISMTNDFDNVVVLRSLTKSFGLAGLRLGYSVSSKSVAKDLRALQVHWSVNGLAQAAGIAALRRPKEYLAKARAAISRERKFLQQEIAKCSQLSALKSDVNYLQVHCPLWDSADLRQQLLKNSGILVRDCKTFTGMGSNHYIRVAVKTRQQNKKLIDALVSTCGK